MLAARHEVGSGATAVPSARRAAVAALRGLVDDEVLDAAELVVSELTGNALLHGAPPVVLVVEPSRSSGGVRVEVHDGSRTLPVRTRTTARPGEQGLTGRGLGLIDAVSVGWGVEAVADGKVVWAELTPDSVRVAEPGTDVDLERLLDGFEEWAEAGEDRYEVVLADVPTDLLLAAKEHVDSIVRELALTSTGAASGVSAALPPHLRDLAHQISDAWSEVRQAIKRQAVAAAERGDQRTSLHLHLPLTAADDGERYLAALEQADTYGRASRLLTLAAPPQHRAFHRWYVSSLVDTLRRAAAGERDAVPPSFESHLLREIDHLATLQQVSARSARLQRASAALSGALDPTAVAETVLTEAVADLGAVRGVLFVPDQSVLVPAASSGCTPDLLAELTAAFRDGLLTPATQAWVGSTAVWVEARSDRPDLVDLPLLEPDAGAACAVPLQVGGHDVGVLSLTFLESRLFSDDERAFLRALAAVAAQALERASLHQSQADVVERLTRLQAVTSALSAARGLEEVLDAAVGHATGLVGAWRASLSLLREDGRTVDLRRLVPSLGPEHTATFSVDDPVPASEAIRTGRAVMVGSLAERDARWPSIAGYAREVEHSLALLPLRADGATLGALTLSFPAGGRAPDPALLQAFADACAQSIARARADERARNAGERLSFLAQASAELAGSLDVERTLAGIARLAVPAVADWCVVHLLQDGELRALAVEHVDPARTALAWDAQRRWPSRLADPQGVAQVVRSGQAQLIADIPAMQAELAATGASLPQRDPEHAALLQSLGLRSALIVPLEARGRTLGALSFITAESGRHYGEDDLALCTDLARRAGVALDNARLFTAATERAAAGLPGRADDGAEAALAAAEVGRFTLDLADGTLESDERIAGFFELDPGQRDTHLQQFLERVHPDDLDHVRAALAAAVEGRDDFAVEHRTSLPSGRSQWLTVRGSVLRDRPDGRSLLVGVAHTSAAPRDVHERTARLLETMADAFIRLDRDWRFTYVNGQAEKLLFRGREELLGRQLWQQFPEVVGSDFERHYREAVGTGQQVSFQAHFGPVGAWFEVRASPDPEGLSVFFHDVSVRRQAEQARAAAAQRLVLLAEATRQLVGALEPGEVLERIARVLVPGLGRWAVAGLRDDQGRLREARAFHAEPERTAWLEQVVAERPYALESVPRVARVLGTGVAELAPGPTPAAPLGVDPDVTRTVGALGYGSAMVVPVQASGTVLGVIALMSGTDEPPFTDDDLSTAVDIGRRAGLALQNAQLFARQRTEVEVLQRSMLTALPQPEGLALTARYRAAGERAQVGGDWYDAFLQPDGATVLVIGDVIGHDTAAAAAMGQLRSLLRGTAFDRQESPARVLSRVDGALRGLAIDTLATALVARLEQTAEQRAGGVHLLRWSSAGHPPAVLLRADGTLQVLEVDGDLLLGLDDAAQRHDHVVEVCAGDTVLLYTDGLVERRDSDLTDGIALLSSTLRELSRTGLEELCDTLLERLLPARADDDVALVALRVADGG